MFARRAYTLDLAGGHRSSVELRPSRNPSLKSSETMPSWGRLPTHSTALRRCATYVATTPSIAPITPIAPMAASATRRSAERQPCRGVNLLRPHPDGPTRFLAGGHRSSVELRPSCSPSLKSSETMPSWGRHHPSI
jgi:hypothetical protein